MIWGYYDESGEYADGKLVNMTIGSCMAPFENWIAFEREWREALAKEGISAFHMTDFEAWVPPFDFKFTDGGRDKEKHNRILMRCSTSCYGTSTVFMDLGRSQCSTLRCQL